MTQQAKPNYDHAPGQLVELHERVLREGGRKASQEWANMITKVCSDHPKIGDITPHAKKCAAFVEYLTPMVNELLDVRQLRNLVDAGAEEYEEIMRSKK